MTVGTSLFSRAAAGQPGAHTTRRKCWKSQHLRRLVLQTARCVAIGASACSSAAAYAVSTATTFGVVGLTTSDVSIVNSAKTTTNASVCTPPGSDVFVEVTLTLAFTSPIAGFLPNQSRNIVAVACYPVTGS